MNNTNIPKILNLSWPDPEIVYSDHAMIQNGVGNFIKLNPDWKVVVHTDDEVEAYLTQNLDKELYELIQHDHIVPKTDIWRLIKLYSEGGMYMDIDRFVNKKMDDILFENTKCVLCTSQDYDFSHDIMITASNNPIFLNIIQLYFQRKMQGINTVYLLGPQTYMHGVTHTLTGNIIDTNPGSEVFQNLRKQINGTGFIQTYRETLPYDSFVYQGEETWDEWEELKRDFYKQNNLKHWTGEW
jgi:mannosyltransferase OCH1-like enzyme